MPAAAYTLAPCHSEPRVNPLHKIGFLLLAAYLFVLYSRVFDIKLVNLHLPALIVGLTLMLTLLGGGFRRAFFSRIGMYTAAFTVWLFFCIPFSFWRTGSLRLVLEAWPRALVTFLAIAGLILNFRQLRHAIYVLAGAFLSLALISFTIGQMPEGRLSLPQGKFDNPNDLAQVLLLGLPFWWFLILKARPLHKVLAGLCALPILASILKTGSRGGLIGLSVLLFLLFLRSPLAGRVGIILGGLAILGVAATFVPRAVLERYTTVFHTEPKAYMDLGEKDEQHVERMRAMAVASVESRQRVLKQSLLLTLRHPIFGVGPLMFAAVDAEEESRKGLRGDWLGTHNSYTQVSSETGLPGLCLYLAILFTCIRSCGQVQKFGATGIHPDSADMRGIAFCLKASLWSYAATTLFSHVAYQTFLPTLAGLTQALVASAGPEFGHWMAARKAAKWRRPASSRTVAGRRAPVVPIAAPTATPSWYWRLPKRVIGR